MQMTLVSLFLTPIRIPYQRSCNTFLIGQPATT